MPDGAGVGVSVGGPPVAVGVAVGVTVGDGVLVAVGVAVGMGVFVRVGVMVGGWVAVAAGAVGATGARGVPGVSGGDAVAVGWTVPVSGRVGVTGATGVNVPVNTGVAVIGCVGGVVAVSVAVAVIGGASVMGGVAVIGGVTVTVTVAETGGAMVINSVAVIGGVSVTVAVVVNGAVSVMAEPASAVAVNDSQGMEVAAGTAGGGATAKPCPMVQPASQKTNIKPTVKSCVRVIMRPLPCKQTAIGARLRPTRQSAPPHIGGSSSLRHCTTPYRQREWSPVELAGTDAGYTNLRQSETIGLNGDNIAQRFYHRPSIWYNHVAHQNTNCGLP